MRRVLVVAITVCAMATPGVAQQITRFAPVRLGGPVRYALPHDSTRVARPGAVFFGNFAGASLGAAIGWGAGYAATKLTYHDRFSSSSLEETANAADFVILGGLGAISGGALGSRIGAKAAGGQSGSFLRRALASGIGWVASLAVGELVFHGQSHPNAAAVLGTISLTQGLVTAITVPKP